MAVRADAPELSARRRTAWGLLLPLLLSAGCTTLDPFACPSQDAPPKGTAYQVVATWNNQVVFSPDPVHGGQPAPGLAGRLYLFGPQVDFPLAGDGSVVVDLYDETADKPVMLEEWRLDPETLGRLLRKDMIGWGYTVFLPWGTCKPEVQRVRLRVCYQPAKGSPLYTESSAITLTRGGDAAGGVAAGKPAAPAAEQAKAPAPASGGVQVSRFQLR